jgi:hypothetical protein
MGKSENRSRWKLILGCSVCAVATITTPAIKTNICWRSCFSGSSSERWQNSFGNPGSRDHFFEPETKLRSLLPADFRLSVNVNEDNSAYKFKHGLGNDQFVEAAFIGPRLGVPYVAMRIRRPNGLHPHPSFLFFPVIDNPDLSCSDRCALFDYVMFRAIAIA